MPAESSIFLVHLFIMARDRVFLVIVQTAKQPRQFLAESFEEMKELAESAGGTVVGHVEVRLLHPSPSHFIREGKLAEITGKRRDSQANVLIFNADLTPVQARNIEASTGTRAVDRTGVILDIFARRAQSKEGRMQVELAQLNYLLPRLVGRGVIMSRLGGGIGTRGPGEQKLEVDRRKIRARIQRIKQELQKVEKHRDLLRDQRRQKNFIQVSIVGYTNAGKSTLLSALTGAETYIEDKMFATLDPKTRRQAFSGNGNRQLLFTDTVGFLKDLPHGLVKAFHATLEEVVMCNVLLHVLDVSHANALEQKRVVENVLKEMKADEKPVVLALNKAELLKIEDRIRIQDLYPEGILISAKEKLGLPALMARLEAICRRVPAGSASLNNS